MPLPGSLVVKKGSNTRASTSWLMPDAGVGDGQAHVLAGLGPDLARNVALFEHNVRRLDYELAAAGHGIARVDGEIEHGILDLAGVRAHRPQARRQQRAERDGLAQRAPQQLGHDQHLLVEIENDGIEATSACEREQPVGQPGAHHRGVVGARKQVALLGTLELHLEQLVVAGDDGQQVVEVVRDAARQLADRLHALRLAQGLVLHDLLADVANKLDETYESARRASRSTEATVSAGKASPDARR